MTKLAATFIFGGFLLMFGAVGGMEDPAKADYFLEQIVVAAVGVFFAFVGTALLPQEQV
jgi:energy-converting hydrogenase Eha subunit E